MIPDFQVLWLLKLGVCVYSVFNVSCFKIHVLKLLVSNKFSTIKYHRNLLSLFPMKFSVGEGQVTSREYM